MDAKKYILYSSSAYGVAMFFEKVLSGAEWLLRLFLDV